MKVSDSVTHPELGECVIKAIGNSGRFATIIDEDGDEHHKVPLKGLEFIPLPEGLRDSQEQYNLTIGTLDEVLSRMVNWGKEIAHARKYKDFQAIADGRILAIHNQQTLKHHAEDMIAAGQKILKDLGKLEGTPQPEYGVPRMKKIYDYLDGIKSEILRTWPDVSPPVDNKAGVTEWGSEVVEVTQIGKETDLKFGGNKIWAPRGDALPLPISQKPIELAPLAQDLEHWEKAVKPPEQMPNVNWRTMAPRSLVDSESMELTMQYPSSIEDGYGNDLTINFDLNDESDYHLIKEIKKLLLQSKNHREVGNHIEQGLITFAENLPPINPGVKSAYEKAVEKEITK